jgi:hypothetical protein
MGVRAIFQLDTPLHQELLFDIGYEQAADVMILTHLDILPMRLTRYAHDNWTLAYANYVATVTPPAVYNGTAFTPNMGTGYVATSYSYVITSIDAATGQESLNTGGIALTNDLTLKGNYNEIEWTAVPGVERYNVYKFGAGTYGFIGTTDGDSFVDDNIAPDFSQSYPRPRDPFQLENDHPAVVTFWQQRAMYARTYNKPNGVWGSQSANLFNFNASRPVNDADAVTFAVSGRRVNAIMHLVPLKSLIILTTDTIFSIKGGDQTGALTPTSIDITPEGYRGASRVRPVVIDDIAMYVTAKGGQLRTVGYQFEADGYKGNDLTVFAPHFFLNVTAVDMAWAEFPLSVVAVPMTDGDVRVLTWQAEQQVWGWTKWQTDGEVESVCTVSEEGEDVLYAVIKRGDKRFIEYMASPRWEAVEDAVYLDSALVYDGDPRTSFRAPHLAGRTIDVLADGAAYQGIVLDSTGAFALTQPASKVVAGLPYESWIRTLPLGAAETKGEPVNIGSVTARFLKTRGAEIGIGKDLPPGQLEPASSDDEIAQIDEVKTRELEPMGEPTRLFSGELQVEVGNGDWRAADIVVRQRYPLPMTVLGLTPDYLPE